MKKIFFLILLPISLNSFSQNIHVSRGIDTNIFKVSEPLNLWLDFLNTKDDSTGSKYGIKMKSKNMEILLISVLKNSCILVVQII